MVQPNQPGVKETARSRRVIGWVSVLLNLVLILVLVQLLHTEGSPQENLSRDRIQVSLQHQTNKIRRANLASRSAKKPIFAFDWNQLVSTNFVTYARNLQAVDCPELTVRDIILPLIEKSFEARKAELQKKKPFWQTGSQRELADRDIARACAKLEQSRLELVREALGFEWNLEGVRMCEGDDDVLTILGFVPQDRLERAFSIFMNYSARLEAVHLQSLGVMTGDDFDQCRKLYINAAKAVIADSGSSWDEIDEAQMRVGALLSFIFRENSFKELNLTANELREWMRLKNEQGILIASEVLRDDPDIQEQAVKAELEFPLRLRSLLGVDRFIKFMRADDGEFNQLAAAFDRKGLSRDQINAAFELMQRTKLETEAIRKQTDLARSERKEQLEAIRQASADGLSKLLGVAADSDLIRTNVPWLNNLVK